MNKRMIICGVLMFLPFGIFTIILDKADTHTIVVDCYDEYYNEMIDIDCYEDEFDNEWFNKLVWLMFIFSILMLFGGLTILFGGIS